MTARRRFTADFKAKVALEALRGDSGDINQTQVSSQSGERVETPGDGRAGGGFPSGASKARVDREGELHDLHAKIGQLTVERDFLARGLKR